MARRNVNPRVRLDLLRQQLDLLRFEAGTRRRVLQILNTMHLELLARLSEGDLTAFGRRRVNALISQAVDAIEGYYARADESAGQALGAAAESAARGTARSMDRALAVVDFSASLPTASALEAIASDSLIMGAPSEEWWARQARDTSFRFSTAVRQGLAAGDTTEQVVARVAGRSGYPGIMDVTRANARSLVHTSIQAVAAEARRAVYRKNDDVVEGVRQVSTLDTNTTEVCMAYDGAEFDLEGEPMEGTDLPYESGVPRHWNCRSIEVPITKTFRALGVDVDEPDAGQRASSEGPVDGEMTFGDFLGTLSEAEQDEALGPGRADLWRDGKITMQQLLDQRGNPLSLAQLGSKYG